MPGLRIVSLLPSATEILYRIGAKRMLTGVSHRCDFPAQMQQANLPIVTSPLPPSIAASPTPPPSTPIVLNEALLCHLKPDVIVTGPANHDPAREIDPVTAFVQKHCPKAHILQLNPRGIEDILDNIIRLGEITNLLTSAESAVVSLRERLFSIQEHVCAFADGRVVGFLVQTQPLTIAGNWIVQLIERAGGSHPLNQTASPSDGFGSGLAQGQRLAGQSIAVPPALFCATSPDALIICPQGLDLNAAGHATKTLSKQPWFQKLPAVRHGKVAIVDGKQAFHRPGPRIVDDFAWLTGWLTDRPRLIPDDFPFKSMNS